MRLEISTIQLPSILLHIYTVTHISGKHNQEIPLCTNPRQVFFVCFVFKYCQSLCCIAGEWRIHVFTIWLKRWLLRRAILFISHSLSLGLMQLWLFQHENAECPRLLADSSRLSARPETWHHHHPPKILFFLLLLLLLEENEFNLNSRMKTKNWV